jgi:type III pantothenate kinase
MLLCDIGNTSYHFLDGDESFKKSVNSFNPALIEEKVYYISVNAKVSRQLDYLENWINLEQFIDRQKYYETMGIDRIVALESVEHGVVIDAGSAVTVDVIRQGVFEGGFILPGITAMQKTYENISDALVYSFNFDLELDIMPKNSQDAISYGYLGMLYREVMSHGLDVILTGGDAQKFKKLFTDAKVEERLLFNAMKKIMKKANIC